jgi:phenylalanine-4-hydroxylase
MRRLKAKEMYMCRVICLDPPSLGRLAGRSDRPNSAALRHNFSKNKNRYISVSMFIPKHKFFSFLSGSSFPVYGHHVLRYQPTVSPKWPVMAQRVR